MSNQEALRHGPSEVKIAITALIELVEHGYEKPTSTEAAPE